MARQIIGNKPQTSIQRDMKRPTPLPSDKTKPIISHRETEALAANPIGF